METLSINVNELLRMPTAEILSLADKTREENLGAKLELCNIMNAKSGLCSEDCKFCAQASRHKSGVPTYPLQSKEEILHAAAAAQKIGAEKFGIVTSGNRLTAKEMAVILETIPEIIKQVGIAVCGSLGALRKTELQALKDAGLTRYHHNIETSANFYPRIVSTHSFQERLDTIKAAKEVGLETCSGGIIGLGESWQDRLDMALLLKELDVDSVPINLLVPIPGTPLAAAAPISCGEAIKTIALFRLLLPNKIIKIAAGRESILKDFQALAFMAGANGMLIGGYLTIKGRALEEDNTLVREIKKLWTA